MLTKTSSNLSRGSDKASDSPMSSSRAEEGKTEAEPMSFVMDCVVNNDINRLNQCFEDTDHQFHQDIQELIVERDENGKSPLEMASILGRGEIISSLLNNGIDVNSTTTSGYSALHFAACWGNIDILKLLVSLGADLDLKTVNGERPRDSAWRYNQVECVDYLDWAEAKQALLFIINEMKDILQDADKHQGRLNRDEKSLALNACNEKGEFVENSTDATTKDFILQKQVLQDTLAPIHAKLSEPVSQPSKGGKKK